MGYEPGRRRHIAYLRQIFRDWAGGDMGDLSSDEDVTVTADEAPSAPPTVPPSPSRAAPSPRPSRRELPAVPEQSEAAARTAAGAVIARTVVKWKESRNMAKAAAKEAARVAREAERHVQEAQRHTAGKASKKENEAEILRRIAESEAARRLENATNDAQNAKTQAEFKKRMTELGTVVNDVRRNTNVETKGLLGNLFALATSVLSSASAPATPPRASGPRPRGSPAGGGAAAVRAIQNAEEVPVVSEPVPEPAPEAEPKEQVGQDVRLKKLKSMKWPGTSMLAQSLGMSAEDIASVAGAKDKVSTPERVKRLKDHLRKTYVKE